MIPVVQRLQSLSKDEWEQRDGNWARLSAKHALESYTSEELAKEFSRLTNYDIWVSIDFVIMVLTSLRFVNSIIV